MKHVTVILILALSMFTTACDKQMQFSSKTLTSLSPGVECVPTDSGFNVPSVVQKGHPFSISFLRDEVVWNLANGLTALEYRGAEVTLTLNELGNFNGLVQGFNNCGKREVREFDINVVEPIDNISIVINDGDVFTNQTDVRLKISAVGATQMYVTNTVNCSAGGVWENYSTDKLAWALSENNKLTNVYIKFKNNSVESPCVNDSIIHDDVVPTLTIASAPSGLVNQTSARIEMVADDNLSGVKSISCRIDGSNNPYQDCASVVTFSGLSNGVHIFEAFATDNAGNVSLPVSTSWTVDATAPVVMITKAPANPTLERNADFEFTVTEVGSAIASVKCKLDNLAETDCVDLISYLNLPKGIHTFSVVARDNAGNVGSASHRWEIKFNEVDQIIPVVDNGGSSDILFVVDNSSSMFSELRESIPYRFARFLEYLGSGYNIGITTGDAVGNRDFEAGGLARILDRPTPGHGVALVPAQYTIFSEMDHPDRYLLATIMRPEVVCVDVSSRCPGRGDPYQEAIRSTLLALQRPDTRSMLREEAPLNVIIISNKDEGNGNLSDANGNILPGTPDYNRPETLVNYVREQFPEKVFKVHSVIRRPQDRTCNSGDVDAEKAPIYNRLSQMTSGKTANICDDRNRSEIEAIAQDIKSSSVVTKYKLQCEPLDMDNDGQPDLTITYDPTPSFPIQYTLDRDTIKFDPAPPVGTNIRAKYICP